VAIKLSLSAESDLLGIFLYGIEEHGLLQAEHYKSQIEKSLKTLSDNPKITRLRKEITPPVRVYPAHKHMIVYTILEDGQTAYVLRVRHHSENWAEHPIE